MSVLVSISKLINILFLFCYVTFLKGMSDLCVNPKETVYFYIKGQSTLQKTGKGNNIKLLYYIIYHYNNIIKLCYNYIFYSGTGNKILICQVKT